MQVKLVVVHGKANKSEVPLKKVPCTIGRSREADLTVAHPMISRQHSQIFEVDGLLMIKDLDSLNGTFVGQQRVREAPLRPEDEFTVGPITFRAVYDYAGDLAAIPQPVLDPKGAVEEEAEPEPEATVGPPAFEVDETVTVPVTPEPREEEPDFESFLEEPAAAPTPESEPVAADAATAAEDDADFQTGPAPAAEKDDIDFEFAGDDQDVEATAEFVNIEGEKEESPGESETADYGVAADAEQSAAESNADDEAAEDEEPSPASGREKKAGKKGAWWPFGGKGDKKAAKAAGKKAETPSAPPKKGPPPAKEPEKAAPKSDDDVALDALFGEEKNEGGDDLGFLNDLK